MTVKIGHASIDERGKAAGGAAGDSTGREVCTRSWYSNGWHMVLRPKSGTLAENSAKACEAGCANNRIGYDQNQRNTLNTQAKAVGYDLAKIATGCECDCSAFMHVCAIAGGAKLSYGSNGYTTRTMTSAFVNSGDYEKLTDSKYLTSDNYLRRGDILVKEGSHTVMVLENGSAATSAPETSITKTVEAVAREVIAGKWGNGADRKAKLKAAGYNPDAVQMRVNELLSGKGASTGKTVDQIAREVIAGKWGNGADRKAKLKAAGYDAAAVQKRVNELL